MDPAHYDLDPPEGFSPLPMYSGSSSSCLNHLVAPEVHLDAGPFLSTLRQVYKDEFSTAVAVAVLKYQDQILELERAFPQHTEGSLRGSTLCFVDNTL